MNRRKPLPKSSRNTVRALATAIAVGLASAACAPVGPDFVRPEVPLNPDWLEAELDQFDSSPAELAEWWRTLEDPVLDKLIETAYQQNNALKIAGLRVLESQARLGIATGNRYPQLQVLAGDASAVGTSESGSGSSTRDQSLVQYNLAATLSWEMDFWGRFRRGIEAADAGYLASIADYDDVLVLLTAQVADVYAIIRATEEQLRLAQESVDIQQRSYDIVQVLYRNGESSELDALQAQTLLLSTKTIIPDLEATIVQSKNALGILLGMQPGQVDALLSEGALPNVPESIAVGVPANLLRQRPDVRKAELMALAQNAMVGVAEANLYPSFSLNGTLGFSSTEFDDDLLDDLFGGDSVSYVAGVSFVWPFFNYGRIRNNIRVEDARLQQALIGYQETVLQAAGEAENALAAHIAALKQDQILQEGVEAARRSADLSLLRYQEGFADYQRVLNAQQALFGQQQRYAANRGEIVRSVIAIYRSLGGGWHTSRSFIDEETRQQMEQRTNWGGLLDETSQ